MYPWVEHSSRPVEIEIERCEYKVCEYTIRWKLEVIAKPAPSIASLLLEASPAAQASALVKPPVASFRENAARFGFSIVRTTKTGMSIR
jgi:hypothetical protein